MRDATGDTSFALDADGDTSLAEAAYHALLGDIVSLALRPGSMVNERDLMERVGLGRAPVREAVHRLALEGLVEIYPRRGIVVAPIELTDLSQITEVRLGLESQAAALAAERADGEDHAELRLLFALLEATSAQNARSAMAVDERIHKSIYRWSHNVFLSDTLGGYYAHSLRIWYAALERTTDDVDPLLEHRQLLQAIHDRDGELAAKLMGEHIERFERQLREVL